MRHFFRLIFSLPIALFAMLWYHLGLLLSVFPVCLYSISMAMFRQATRFFMYAFGLRVTALNTRPKNDKPMLFIANHDSILDALFLHGYTQLCTIIDQGISKFPLLCFKYYLSKYQHFIFDRNNKMAKQQAYQFAARQLQHAGQFFIFPSGAIKRKITHYVANSIYRLAKQEQALVVPMFINYLPTSLVMASTTDRQLISQLLWGSGVKLCYSYGQAIDVNSFSSMESFEQHIQALYRANIKAYAKDSESND